MNRFKGWVSALLLMLVGLSPLAASAQSNEFNGATIGSGWTTFDGFAAEYPWDTFHHATFQMTGTQLSISFPGSAEHNMWWLRHAAALRSYPGTGIYETKVDSAFTGDQQFGLVFQSAPGSFLIFMLYAGDEVRAYVERFANVGGTQYRDTVAGTTTGVPVPTAGPYYIRVSVIDNSNPAARYWKFEWSKNGSTWYELAAGNLEGAAASQNAGALTQVGVFAGNQPDSFDPYDARFDYFRYDPNVGAIPPSAPTDLIAQPGNGRVDLKWNASAAATSYAVYNSSTAGGPYSLVGTTSSLTYAHTGLTNNVKKYYIVKARTGTTEGSASVERPAVPHSVTSMATLPTSGLVLALNASELSHVLTNGQSVTHWPSALGAVTAAFGSSSSAPTYIASAINGKGAVRFDGSDDYLTVSAGFQDFTAGLSIYVVAKPTVLQSGFKLLALGNGASQQNIGLGRAGNTTGLEYWTDNSGGGTGWFNTGDAIATNAARLYSVIQEPGAADSLSFAEAAANGTPLYGQNVYVPPVASRNVNYIGKSYWAEGLFQGDIAEILVYNRTLNDAEQQLVHEYVAAKYAINVDGGGSAVLEAPASLTAVPGNQSVALSWPAVSGATGYRVYRTTTQGGTPVQIQQQSGTSFNNTGLTNGTTYYYTVKAYNASLESEASPTASAKPNPPPTLNPALPTSGLLVALDATNAALNYSNGQAVSLWQDVSGANYHASGVNGPTLVTNAINGKAALRFDGIDDYLTLPAGFQNFTAGMTFYIVAKPTTLQSGIKLLALGNGANAQNIGLGRNGTTSGMQYFTDDSNGNTGWFNSNGGFVANQTTIFSAIQDGGSANSLSYAEVAANGIAQAGNNVYVPPVVQRGTNYIGKSFWAEGMFQGDIAEVILYNRKLTTQEQAAVRSYLGQKYGVSVP